MDYGVNYMFFAVTAANFSGSWQPSFQIGGTGIGGTSTREVTAVDWMYSAGSTASATWNATSGSGTAWTAVGATVSSVTAQGGTTVGASGECIVVRLTVDNNKAETIVDAPISLAVDGVMADPATGLYTNRNYADINNADCTDDHFDNDISTQILSPRPDINAVTPTPFVTQR